MWFLTNDLLVLPIKLIWGKHRSSGQVAFGRESRGIKSHPRSTSLLDISRLFWCPLVISAFNKTSWTPSPVVTSTHLQEVPSKRIGILFVHKWVLSNKPKRVSLWEVNSRLHRMDLYRHVFVNHAWCLPSYGLHDNVTRKPEIWGKLHLWVVCYLVICWLTIYSSPPVFVSFYSWSFLDRATTPKRLSSLRNLICNLF